MASSMARSTYEGPEYRIVAVGKTGNGKSSLCNSLLGDRCFKTSVAAASTTQICERQKRCLPDKNITLSVVDTPGVFDTSRPQVDILNEIIKCIALAAPGPHVFLFVLSIRRYTKEEHESFELLEELFEAKAMKYAIVVFTGKDQLEDDDDDGINTVEDFINQDENNKLRELLRKCGNRYVGISNKRNYPSHKSDVDDVMRKIRETVELNGNQFYDQKLFKRADEIIQKKVDEQKEISPQKSESEIREEIEREIAGDTPNRTGIWEAIKGPIADLIKAAVPVLVNVAISRCTIS